MRQRKTLVSRWPRLAAATLLVASLAGATALAADPALKKSPGFVDPEPFLDLADEKGRLIEINLPGKLLRLITGPVRSQEPELASLIDGLEWIGAVIVGTEDAARLEAGRALVRQTEKRLLGKGWEKLAVMQEEGTMVKVLILNTETTIGGLVVMITNDEQVIFTNIAGIIDLAKLESLGETLNIPGLESLGQQE